ncbi:gallinacin-10 [Pogona vitticeps]|uniref:Gallinacin-10-like n=1 Tax=Pogona vitticeps TaxID=103695 RepID=A0A6J0SBN0_9SAUR
MRILYFFFAVFVFLFQISPGYTQPPPLEDTIACRSLAGFCKAGACPPTHVVSGTCHGGLLNCCKKDIFS